MNGDAENSLEVKLAAALLEEVLEGLAEQVHDHNMVGLVILCLLIADEVQIGHTGYRYVNHLHR